MTCVCRFGREGRFKENSFSQSLFYFVGADSHEGISSALLNPVLFAGSSFIGGCEIGRSSITESLCCHPWPRHLSQCRLGTTLDP